MKHNFIMLDYPALAALAMVVREGTFERAAERLGITPSAVSQRVRGLEERLGGIVVVRGQPCVATDLGRQLVAHVSQVQLLEADLAPQLALDGAGPPTIRLAVNSDSMSTWFAPAAARFVRESGCLLDFIIEDEQLTAGRLRTGEVLGAVSADPGTVPGCKTIELGNLDYYACCSPAFAERHFAQGVTAETLNKAPCLRFEMRDGLQARWAREVHGVKLDAPMHWVPSTNGFLHFTRAGMAWGMQPAPLARPWIEAGELVELSPGAPITVTLYWTVVRLHAGPLKALTDAVTQVARASLLRPS